MAELRSLSYKVFLTFLICGLFCFYAFMFFLSSQEHEDKFSSLGTGNRIATVLAYVSHYLKIHTSLLICCIWERCFFSQWQRRLEGKNDSLVTMVTSPDVLPLCYRDSCVCITVSNSPNPSPVYIRLCKHGKGFPLNVFYKLSFPRRNAKLLVMALIKEKLSPVVKSCTRILARVITSCFAKNMLSKFWIFLA